MQKKSFEMKIHVFFFLLVFIVMCLIFFVNNKLEKKFLHRVIPLLKIEYDISASKLSLRREIDFFGKMFYGFDFSEPLKIIALKLPVVGLAFDDLGIDEKCYDRVSFEQKKYITNQSSVFFEPEHDVQDGIYKNLGDLKFVKEANVDIDLNKLSLERVRLKKDKKGPRVMIYHTHTTESYLGREQGGDIISRGGGTVVDVGNKLKKALENEYNISTLHNSKDHTPPELRTSYIRSLETARSFIEAFPSIDVLIDLHRDGLANVDRFAPRIKVDGKYVAQIMIVVGTNFSGLKHPNWQENLAFAVTLQELLEEICPGITRPIYISGHRYNQHLSSNAVILEIGGNGNTVQEAKRSAEIFAKALSKVF